MARSRSGSPRQEFPSASGWSKMSNVTVLDHPLIQHKLTIMRNKETSIAGFRRLLREIAHLMCYEVTRDLELEMIPIETPMSAMDSPAIKGKKLVFASILRAGNGLLDGMLDLEIGRAHV